MLTHVPRPHIGRSSIAKNQNTFAKRQREMDKKMKAEAKRARRIAAKDAPPVVYDTDPDDDQDLDSESDDDPSGEEQVEAAEG